MGFLSPKVQQDPTALALQNSQDETAKSGRISLLSDQLGTDTRLRAQRFGTRAQMGGLGASAAPSLLSGIFGGGGSSSKSGGFLPALLGGLLNPFSIKF